MRRPLLTAIVASAAVVLSTPYVGQARAAVQAAFPGQYRAIVAAVIGVALAAGLGLTIARIRDNRAARYGALSLALALAVGYAVVIRTGEVERDLVERFHFVEYGLLAVLFSAAFRARPDASAVVLPLCAGLLVGIADEWFQWFVPTRVGELSDVLLNAVAVASGVLGSAAVQPPRSLARPAGRSGQLIAAGMALVTLAAALFVDAVHLGHTIADPAVGAFSSTFAPDELALAAADRAERWRRRMPATEQGIAREDHYLSEGRWHLQRRNEHLSAGDRWAASRENLIVERYFGPVLALADPAARWSPDARAAIDAEAGHRDARYVSDAAPYPIFTVSRGAFWLATAAFLAVAGLYALSGRRSAVPAATV